jgi:hypothetical protein
MDLLGHLHQVTSQPQTAEVTALLVLAVGATLLARALYRPPSSDFVVDSKPNTASIRGSFVPMVIGTRRVGAVTLWVGDRIVVVEEEEAGGKGFGGASTIKKNVYYERAIHALCVGPASRLRGIFVDGKLIPGTADIDSRLSPSGTAFSVDGYGAFRIYWGEISCPPGSLTERALGIDSDMPYVCRIEWDRFRIENTRWPLIEYEIEVPGCMSDGPIDKPEVGNGVNPAQAIWQLLTAEYPHGCDLSPSKIDCDSLIALGELAEQEEHGVNLLIPEGKDVAEAISLILQDMAVMLVERDGVLRFVPLRKESGTLPELSDEVLLPPSEEVSWTHIRPFGNSIIYRYADSEQNYKPGTIDVDDDSDEGIRNARESRTIDLPTVTSRSLASSIVARRQVEDLTSPVRVVLSAVSDLRHAAPGMLFSLPSVGSVRVTSVTLSMEEPGAKLDCVLDPYQVEVPDYSDPALPGTPPSGALKADKAVRVVEVPFMASGGTPKLAILRVRDNPSIFNASVMVSADGSTYSPIGYQPYPATGGVVVSDWNPSDEPIVEEGPEFTIDGNGDELSVPLNLAGYPDQWVSGQQILVCDEEILYVRELEQVAGSLWRAKGVIRSRLGASNPLRAVSSPEFRQVEAGSRVFVIPVGSMVLQTSPIISSAAVRYVKSVPMNSGGTFPAGGISPEQIEMRSLATVTPPIAWLRCGGDRGCSAGTGRRDQTYNQSESLIFEWLPSAKVGGAGSQGFGQASPVSAPSGSFRIEVRFDPTLLAGSFEELETQATHDVTASPDSDGVYRWSYTPVMRASDGSDAEDFSDSGFLWEFRISHLDGTQSEPTIVRPRHVSSTQIPS